MAPSLVLAAAACGSNELPVAPPPTCRTSAAQNVTLPVRGAYQALTPLADIGCLVFPANGSSIDSVEYLVVPQLATDSEGRSAGFVLVGDTLHVTAAANSARAAATVSLSPGLQFHDLLRQMERQRSYPLGPYAGAAAPPSARLRLGPPLVGDRRTFKVCSNLTCSTTATVVAFAKTVSSRLAIYVDSLAPANGLTQSGLDSLGALFDNRLYAIDTTAFGRESDIDGNSVVIVLMTNAVNKLITAQQCNSTGGSYVAGFFFGADIDPQFASQYNHGEIFYSIVADPNGTLSCAHSAIQLQQQVPVTFIHEFQHMISYNQHVLIGGGESEVLWLNEGMSHFAEELGGRSFLPNDTLFSRFVINDLYNAYTYLDAPGDHFLAPASGGGNVGTLAERGAAWLFVRYMVDQFRADTSFTATAAFTRKIDETNLVGSANVQTQTGVPFATLVERWALANYVSDLPGFTAPNELRYTSWQFRSEYANLNSQCFKFQPPCPFAKPFPLTPPASDGPSVQLGGTLRAGSGVYLRVVQLPSQPGFTLYFSGNWYKILFAGPYEKTIPAELNPRLNIIRIR
jgi:hypothetical protein